MNDNKELKELVEEFEGNEETLAELSNGKGDDEDE